jgi:TM2 domain-containing membrane protein YozV
LENQNTQEVVATAAVEQKSWVVALLLAFFLGVFGGHRFYVGKKASGIAMLVLTVLSPLTLSITLIISALWAFVDFILILIGNMKDAAGQELKK